MSSWQEFAAERPEMAAAGTDLFQAFTIGYLATVRGDGTPRLHPVTVTLHEGQLYICAIARSYKARDLRRDGRYALHSFPRFPDDHGWSDEEFMVAGRADEVGDPAERAAVLAAHNDTVAPDDPLFRLSVERAFHKVRRDGAVVHTAWNAGSASREREVTRTRITEPTIEAMTPDDWSAVRSIYEDGIATRNATFETSPPEWEAWDAARRPDCRLVARVDGRVVGWAALSPYSSRHAYRGVAEVSVYIAASARGKGIGAALLRALIVCAEAAGVWTLQAGIFPENEVSIHLHSAEGFRVVGRRERIGQLDGEWRDVVLMERRSAAVG